MSKKKLSLEDLGGFVFSTNKDFEFEKEEIVETLSPEAQRLEAHLEKHKAGKITTIIKGFIGTEEDLKTLAKELKVLCGVGGSAKNDEIIIQGNFRDKIMEHLIKKGYKVKRVGG